MRDRNRVAAFDIGTNTALCLVLEAESDGIARVLLDRHAIARLGEGVDKTHIISDAAFDRFANVMRDHLAAVADLGVCTIVAVGTSALRDATNREQILYRAKTELGIDITIISGHEEAELTYRGALAGMQLAREKVAALDIGGGSTELAVGSNGAFELGQSINIGAVRMTERYFRGSTPHALGNARNDIHAQLEVVAKSIPSGVPLVAVAGTPTSLACMDLGLTAFDTTSIHGHILEKSTVERFVAELATTNLADMMQRYPVIAKGRADILLAGSLILLETMGLLGLDEARVSTRGLRYGVAIDELERTLDLRHQRWQITA